MRQLDRLIRRLIPSTVLLSRNRLLMAPLDAIDRICCRLSPETRNLPPNRYRLRVGVGNRLLFNQPYHLTIGLNFWLHAFAEGYVQLDSHIVDIGCGCGRFAAHLRDFHYAGDRSFEGHYTGIDVDSELIDWCRSHFPAERFTFHHTNTQNRLYNPDGDTSANPYALPLGDASQDFVFSTSLFTHLLEDDVRGYLKEARRLLKPGRIMAMSAFCLEHADTGGRFSFAHPVGIAKVESVSTPNAAVAYPETYLTEAALQCGFSSAHVLPSPSQSMLVCRV